MRIALRHTGEVGVRAGRMLLAERSLDILGMLDSGRVDRGDPRVVSADELGTYDVLVTDDTGHAAADVEAALEAGISCVTWVDDEDLAATYGDAFLGAQRTLLTGARFRSGIAPCLVAHHTVGGAAVLDATWAWTEPGRAYRRGVPVAFPDPVGPRWGREVDTEGSSRSYRARTEPPWMAAMARVTTGTADGVVTHTVGVADLDVHLESIALAAGALAHTSYGYGAVTPADRAGEYLAAAQRIGLDIAIHESVQ